MISNIRFLLKSEFTSNVFLLFKGVFIAQLISFVGALALAKLYGKEAYGMYNIFLSISGILLILFTLNFEQAIVIAKKKLDSIQIFNSILGISLLIYSTVNLLAFALSLFIIELKSHWFLFFLGSTGALMVAHKNTAEMYLTRIGAFNFFSKARVLIAVLTLLFQLVFFYLFYDNGLIYGTIAALITLLFYLFYTLKDTFQVPELAVLKKQLIFHQKLISIGLPSSFLNGIANNFLPILIASYFSLATAGVYALSLKIVLTPMLLLASSVSQVYFQKASEMFVQSPEKLYNFTKKIVVNNVILIGFILLILNTIGIFLLEFIFKKDWENLRLYMLIISFYVLCRATFNPISYITTVVNKLQIELYLNLYLIVINLAAIYIGYIYQNLLITVVLFSVFCGLGYIFSLFYFLKIIRT